MGNGVFHIRGPLAAPGDTCTTRAGLDFGFNNPYYENSGTPVSYRVECTVSYNNWNDIDGYVELYVRHDNGDWVLIWNKTDLDGGYWPWSAFPSSRHYRCHTAYSILTRCRIHRPGRWRDSPNAGICWCRCRWENQDSEARRASFDTDAHCQPFRSWHSCRRPGFSWDRSDPRPRFRGSPTRYLRKRVRGYDRR